MSCITPTRPLESSAKRLLKRVHMCTERSFVCTPVRHRTSKRKTAQLLSSTLSSGITLLSVGDQTLIGDHTINDNSLLSLDKTLTENNNKKNLHNDTTMTAPWEVVDSMDNDGSGFSVITMNESNISQITVISKQSTKASTRSSSIFTRILKPSISKTSTTGVKFINRCVRDIDRLSDTFGQEWITLPNFV
ncbi:unnamed protein product [Adineta steineri]|uniref:Uncharacterized protein n=1 Tax=Adineta steineri TaxID=433720 RepID=A0A815EET4_9BILA|nr:unnamed protein product [Adineta steineri]CAF3554999.1 unnamed protein product [Adineta steineri]